MYKILFEFDLSDVKFFNNPKSKYTIFSKTSYLYSQILIWKIENMYKYKSFKKSQKPQKGQKPQKHLWAFEDVALQQGIRNMLL